MRLSRSFAIFLCGFALAATLPADAVRAKGGVTTKVSRPCKDPAAPGARCGRAIETTARSPSARSVSPPTGFR